MMKLLCLTGGALMLVSACSELGGKGSSSHGTAGASGSAGTGGKGGAAGSSHAGSGGTSGSARGGSGGAGGGGQVSSAAGSGGSGGIDKADAGAASKADGGPYGSRVDGGGGSGNRGGTGGGGGRGGSAGRGGSGGTTSASGDCAGPACGPKVEEFFDLSKLATIRITFDAADTGSYTPAKWLDLLWSKWNHCPPFDASDYVRVTFQYESPDHVGDVTMKNVGMRLRGSKQRGTNQIQGFKLNFEKLIGTATGASRRRFADLNQLNVLSIESDPSHSLQCLAYKALRDFGQPAPYCTHLKVYVNGTYYGLLETVEDPENGRFHAHHFGTTAGETYWGSPSQGECTGEAKFNDSQAKLLYSGASFSSYASQYKITRGSTSTAEQHLLPMLKCGDATQTPSDSTFESCIAEWIDVDEWLREIAAESLMPTLESFICQRNFLLYFVPDDTAPHGGRFLLSSWDLDTAFNKQQPANGDPFTSIPTWFTPGTRAKLGTRLTSVFKTRYCQALRNFLSTVYKTSLVEDMQTVIASGMQNDPATTTAAWTSEMSSIKDFITSHGKAALTTVNNDCK